MPALRIISDVLSRVFIDGEDHGRIEPEFVGTYNLSMGDHIVTVVSVYNDTLKLKRIIHVGYDRAIEFNICSLLLKNKDILMDLELFRFERNGKTGFFEPITRAIVIDPVFDSCSLFNKNGFSIVKLNGNQGVINKKGDLIIPCEYTSINSYDKCFLVKKNDEYGLLDENGKLLFGMIPYEIHTCYDQGSLSGWYYSDGRNAAFLDLSGETVLCGCYDFFSIQRYEGKSIIIAHKNGENYSSKKHVFNSKGRLILDRLYDSVTLEDGLIKVSVGNWGASKEGLYDMEGHVILPVEYDEIMSYSGGFFYLEKGTERKTVRFDGTRFNPWPYSIIYRKPTNNCIYFSDGEKSLLYNTHTNQKCALQCENVDFFPDERGHDNENGCIKVYRNGKCGIVGPMPQCRPICDCIYDSITEFINGYACVEQNRRYGAIDMSGRLIIPCKYGMEFFFSKDGYAAVFNYWKNNDGYLRPNDIIDIHDNSVLGFHPYMNIDWSHENTRDTHPAIGARTKDHKCCIIDFNGNLLGCYDINSTLISTGSNGYFVTNKENNFARRGWVNSSGKEIIPCKYDEVSPADTHLLWCSLYGKYALFSDEGKQLTDFVYEEVEEFHNGYAIARRATGYGILSSSGREVTDFFNESVDQFFVGHQFGDYDVYDVDSDEEGGAYYTLAAEIEGPFRYGIASLKTGKSVEPQILIDVQGNRIKLHNLEECATDSDSVYGMDPVSRNFGVKSNSLRTIEYYTKVSGVTYGERQSYIASLRVGDQLSMRRERQNQYDQNAIALYDSSDRHLGYVPKDLASKLAPIMDLGERLEAVVMSITGGNGYSYGLNIKIDGIVNDSL